MRDRLARQILEFVGSKDYRPREIEQLARAMNIGADEQGDFHDACKALMRTGRIVIGSQNAVMLPPPPGRVIGTFRGNPRGFGFIIPDTPNAHGDFYVPPDHTGGAITGDVVAGKVRKRGKRQGKMQYEARVESIIKRGQSRFVGELCKRFNRWFVIPDGHALHVPIIVADPGAKGGKPGDQVVVEIFQYPDVDTEARGVIVKVLGRRGEPSVELSSIIEVYQLPTEFSEAVLEEARRAIRAFDADKESEWREDLRKQTIITIDPIDAKDFDDAISITKNDDDTWELGVHIADVAHFVRAGGALDQEAQARSNSVYLPGTVIPMLPEVLSNGVCSLQEKEPRLTKSAFITYDALGNVLKSRLASTIIQSTKRLAYEQAAAILDGKGGRISAKIKALLKDMESLARAIQARRQREGMLELDMPEVEMVYDDDGAVIDVVPADQSYPHKIIEMFMVEANEAVARTMTAHEVDVLRRVHAPPGALADVNLRRFLAILGHEIPKDANRFDLQALLKEVHGKPESFAVNLAVLRSMQRAEYAPAQIGHFALASVDYCHFTSPIRRYPDLTVHRLVDVLTRGKLEDAVKRGKVPSFEELEEIGAECSNNERRAEGAENELKLVLILRLLETKLGDIFEGTVTGLANVGVFVQLDHYLVEGLMRFDRLADDWWELDPSHGAVIGERSGKQITVGDRVKVRLAGIDIPQRRIELDPATPLGRKRAKGKKGQTAKVRTRSPKTKGRNDRKGGRKKKVGPRKRRGG